MTLFFINTFWRGTGNVLKEGTLILSRDEMERVEFETSVMLRFFELKPYLDEYRMMLSERIKGAE